LAEMFKDIKLGTPTGIERRAEIKFRSPTLLQSVLKLSIAIERLAVFDGVRLNRLLIQVPSKLLTLKCGPNQMSRSNNSGSRISLILPATIFNPCIKETNNLGGLIVVLVVEVSIQSFILP